MLSYKKYNALQFDRGQTKNKIVKKKKEQEIAIQLSPSGIYRSIIYKFHGKQKLLVT